MYYYITNVHQNGRNILFEYWVGRHKLKWSITQIKYIPK